MSSNTVRNKKARVSALVAIGAIVSMALTGCQPAGQQLESQESTVQEPPVQTSTSPTSSPSVEAFDPKIKMAKDSETSKITDLAGSVISLSIAFPVAKVTGVDPEIAKKFAESVAQHKDAVLKSAQAYSTLEIPECEKTCDREATFTLEHAGIYKEYGTVATTSAFTFGTRDRNPGVHSTTMHLKTGERAKLADFLDLEHAKDLKSATAALKKTENWAYCRDSAAEYLAQATSFSPTDGGLLLLWPVNGTNFAACGVDRVVVPWAGPAQETQKPAATAPAAPTPAKATASPKAKPAAKGINGIWCPSAESPQTEGCVTIALPKATFEKSGRTIKLTSTGKQGGAVQYITTGAPFGGYYPAGAGIDLPSYYPGADKPKQDRIWNSQTATLLVRR